MPGPVEPPPPILPPPPGGQNGQMQDGPGGNPKPPEPPSHQVPPGPTTITAAGIVNDEPSGFVYGIGVVTVEISVSVAKAANELFE